MQISQSQLKSILDYDRNTGRFVWISNRSPKTRQGDIAGCVLLKRNKKYIKIVINSKYYAAHRLAWLYEYGEFPEDQIDHINGDGTDNRIANLRCVNQFENAKNQKIHSSNTSGCTGVYFDKNASKWRARLTAEGRTINLGAFVDLADAIKSRMQANTLFGFHANHGSHRNC